MKKRILAALFAVLMICTCLSSCGGKKKDDGKLRIVTTVFPVYDWVRNIILGVENAKVEMLIDNGMDLHSFQPTANDIKNIETADVFVYVGGESDAWVDDLVENVLGDDIIVVNLMDALGDAKREEELVEGMEEHEHDEHEEHEEEYDEHIWLSLRNAQLACGVLAEKIGKADPDNADTFKKNAEAYIAQLDALDGKYTEVTANAKNKTLIFGDRFPFLYMMKDYGIEYFAAFSGCSTESQASLNTLRTLSDKLNEYSLDYIIALEGSDHSVAEQVIKTSGRSAEVLSMDSMQSITSNDVSSGCTYLSIMEKNLTVLEKALG